MMAKFDSKRVFWILLNTVLAISVIVLFISAKALWRYSKSVFPSRVINVTAEGKVIVSPDLATISFSVISEGNDPEKLQNDNNAKIDQAIEFVKQQGVDSKDIKTAGYNLMPRYEYDEKKRRSFISGYTLTQTVVVKIRDLKNVAKILAGLPNRGVNEISGPNFTVDDPDKFLNQAREEAFAKARAKAESMARQNSVRIKRVITFNEFGGGSPYPAALYEAALGKGGDFGGPVAPSIEPGSQEVRVQVSVTYEIW